jgi:hypothetical protein
MPSFTALVERTQTNEVEFTLEPDHQAAFDAAPTPKERMAVLTKAAEEASDAEGWFEAESSDFVVISITGEGQPKGKVW